MRTRHMISFDWATKNQLRNKANFDILEGLLSMLLGCHIITNYTLNSNNYTLISNT